MIESTTLWYVCLRCWGVWIQGEIPCECEADVLAYRGFSSAGRPVENVNVAGDYL